MIVNSLKFSSGSTRDEAPLDFRPGSVTIFVGPNNGGKSTALRNIFNRCNGNFYEGRVNVVAEMKFRANGENWANAEFDKIKSNPKNNEKLSDIRFVWIEINGQRQQVAKDVFLGSLTAPNEDEKHQQIFGSQWLRHYVRNLDGASRLSLMNSTDKGNLATPTNTFARLFNDDDARKSLWKTIADAIGMYPFMHSTNGSKLEVVMSNDEPKADEHHDGSKTLEHIKAATKIEELSDGIRAFVGTLVETRSGNLEVVCVDEPEAFLHPGLTETLGREMCKAAKESNKQLFIATHSPYFLAGAIQSGADINIVRLTFLDGVGTARLMSDEKLRILIREPKYRSVGMLPALFANYVIVGEGDSDKAFYEEIHTRMALHELGKSAGNTVFLHSRGKDRMKDIILPLREMGIPTAGIADLDMIKNRLADVFNALGVPQAQHAGCSALRGECHKILSAEFGKTKDGKKDNRWSGGVGKLESDKKVSVDKLISDLAEYGLFLNPNGELEDWLHDLNINVKSKDGWLFELFEKLGHDPNDKDNYVSPGDDDVWDFMREVEKWLKNPERKGIPN